MWTWKLEHAHAPSMASECHCECAAIRSLYAGAVTEVWDNAKRKRAWTPEQRRWSALKEKYGMTPEDFQRMVHAQAGRCPICDRELEKPHVDHCHTLGHVRGILCRECNLGIGIFREDVKALIRAAAYLERNREAG